MPELKKVLGLAVAVAVVGALGLIWLPRLLGKVAGPEVELITRLKEAEKEGLELSVLGGTLTGKKVHYQRITVTHDPAARRATVLATLDFTGALGRTEVSSLGVEKISFVYDGTDWKPESSLAPRLVAVVTALESRRRALEAGNRGAAQKLARAGDAGLGSEADAWLGLLERKLSVDAWFIRLERDQVQVSEQYRLEGFGRDRPFRSAGPRRLDLQASEGEFFFPNGLM
ncbi:MAG: hypothetical protein H6Q89_2018 [Myxococcaceae bacterium]|nr:hypothetical protein [Myxococcaceae bacterium]